MLRSKGVLGALIVGVLLAASAAQAHPRSREPRRRCECDFYEPPVLRLDLERGRLGTGRGHFLGFYSAIEGRWAGVNFRSNTLLLPAKTHGPRDDRFDLMSAHVMMAFHHGEQDRMRLELGVSRTHLPGVTFVGPSLGLSAEGRIVGALSIEGRVHLMPLPLRQLDAEAGLALRLGLLSLRGGWRGLLLYDPGFLTGTARWRGLGGPYVGAGLAF